MTQTEQILNHLKRGKSITPIQALNRFGCLRLSARIWEIKESGVEVKSKLESKNGKTYAKYFL